MAERVIRIGGASGSWGDSPMAIPQLLTDRVDYLMMDFLAEVTMSLLARAKLRDPATGFPADFVRDLAANLPAITERKIRVVTNAGGVNPMGCRDALNKAAADLGLSPKIAVVTGDDVLDHTDLLQTEEAWQGPLPDLLTANAYLGALPIKAALAAGADIVITGRCADSALALGILMYEFGWDADDYDRLAAGSLAGHVIECGPQATGGIHTDWDKVPGWDSIGYPIAACHPDGSFILSKPPETGGLITPGVVAEQVLYEVGDPADYRLPDVTADFSGVSVAQVDDNRVRVSGARGRPPSESYKVSATWIDAYRAIATISIVGPEAAAKADRTARALVARGRAIFAQEGFADFCGVHSDILGAEAAYPEAQRNRSSREVVMRLVVDHSDRRALERFSKEIGSVGISFSPGTTGILGGRPRATPLIRLLTCFVEKPQLAAPLVSVDGDIPIRVPIPPGRTSEADPAPPQETATEAPGETEMLPLRRLAFARSGDKGDASNIAIIARRPEYLATLRRVVTAERLQEHFGELVEGPVERFDAPGLYAVNVLMQRALGGGGIASARIDPQGKAFGQMALEMEVPVPRGLLNDAEKAK